MRERVRKLREDRETIRQDVVEQKRRQQLMENNQTVRALVAEQEQQVCFGLSVVVSFV